MQIMIDNVRYLSTNIEKPTWADQIELMNLISADITISAGEKSVLYDKASLIDFAVQIASAFMAYLTSGRNRISFMSPDYQDSIAIEMQSNDSIFCKIIIGGETFATNEPCIQVLSSTRAFLHQVRSLIDAQYGHIEHLWEFLVVSVF